MRSIFVVIEIVLFPLIFWFLTDPLYSLNSPLFSAFNSYFPICFYLIYLCVSENVAYIQKE